MYTRLPIPPHFDLFKANKLWRVKYEEIEKAGQAIRNSVSKDHEPETCLVLIDCQCTFCIPGGELFVAGRSGHGAVYDTVRLASFIYENLPYIDKIVATLDTHHRIQIFHAPFWVNRDGEHPGPNTVITSQHVRDGVWQVSPQVFRQTGLPLSYLEKYSLHYTEELERKGKPQLVVWPFHAMLGSVGHALVPTIEEAITYHSAAHQTEVRYEMKGDHPLTEMYSVFRPEVQADHRGNAVGKANSDLVDYLSLGFRNVIFAGQAKSHCLAWSLEDFINENGGIGDGVYILQDCTSPVVVPQASLDFTDQADAAFQRFAEAGAHLVNSTDSMNTWPGLESAF